MRSKWPLFTSALLCDLLISINLSKIDKVWQTISRHEYGGAF